jgi:hypothetical protein
MDMLGRAAARRAASLDGRRIWVRGLSPAASGERARAWGIEVNDRRRMQAELAARFKAAITT